MDDRLLITLGHGIDGRIQHGVHKLSVALVMLAGWLVLGEPFTLKAAAGGGLIVLGSLILLL